MPGIPVVISTNGRGIPVKQVNSGAPVMTVSQNGLGIPIVLGNVGQPFVVEGAGIVLSAYSVPENSATDTVVGALSVPSHPSGSSGWSYVLTSQSRANWFKVVSGSLKVATVSPDYETDRFPTVTITASKSGQTDLVRTLPITVTNVFEAASLSALSFSGTLAQNASSPITIGNKTAGSTLSLVSGSLPAGMTLGASSITGTPTTLGTGSATIRETLADSANSPRDTVWNWTVTDTVLIPAMTKALVEGCSFDDADGEPLAAACTDNSLAYYKSAVAGTGFGPGAGTYTSRLSTVVAQNCDFALVGGSGPNDLTGSTATAYLSKQNDYLTTLRSNLKPGSLICMAGIPYTDQSGGGSAITYNDNVDTINAANRAAAGNGVIDVYIPRFEHPITGTRAAMSNPAYTSDGTHPIGQMNTDGEATVSAVVAAIKAQAGTAGTSAPTDYSIPAITNATISTTQSTRFVVPNMGPAKSCTVSIVSHTGNNVYIARGNQGIDSNGHATGTADLTVICGDVVTVTQQVSGSYSTETHAVISVGGVQRTASFTSAAFDGVIASDTFNRSDGAPVSTPVGSKTWVGPALIATNKLVLGQNVRAYGAFDPGSGDLDITWSGVEIVTSGGFFNQICPMFGAKKNATNVNDYQSDFDGLFFVDLYFGAIFCRYNGGGGFTNYTSQSFTGFAAGTYDVNVVQKISTNSLVLKVNGSTVSLTNGGNGNMWANSTFRSGGNYVGVLDEANHSYNKFDGISVIVPA